MTSLSALIEHKIIEILVDKNINDLVLGRAHAENNIYFRNTELFFWLLGCCFHGVRCTESENTADARQQQWLLELMGHMRNLATGIAKLPDGSDLQQVSD